jgi:hypothetical protein
MDGQRRGRHSGGIQAASAAGCVAVLMLLGAGVPAFAQQADAVMPIKSVVSVNVLMVKFVDQAADAIWTAAVKPPKNACEWEQVEYRATQLATTGTLLKLGGTGPRDMQWRNSSGWAPFADHMTDLALRAAQAAVNKDLPALKAVGDELILNCEACHRAFKPAIPTQGIATHLAHTSPSTEGLITTCPRK